jgi:hypothetical protein
LRSEKREGRERKRAVGQDLGREEASKVVHPPPGRGGGGRVEKAPADRAILDAADHGNEAQMFTLFPREERDDGENLGRGFRASGFGNEAAPNEQAEGGSESPKVEIGFLAVGGDLHARRTAEKLHQSVDAEGRAAALNPQALEHWLRSRGERPPRDQGGLPPATCPRHP